MCREVTLLARLLERMPCRRPMRAARALALLIAFFVLLAGAGRAWAACPAGQAPTGPNGACLCANGTPPLQGACINLVCQAGQPMTASGICCAPGTMLHDADLQQCLRAVATAADRTELRAVREARSQRELRLSGTVTRVHWHM